MARDKRRVEFTQRWNERAARIILAAFAAVAARAAADDVALAVVALVVLMAAAEISSHIVAYHYFKRRIRILAKRKARRVELWSRKPGLGHRTFKRRPGIRR